MGWVTTHLKNKTTTRPLPTAPTKNYIIQKYEQHLHLSEKPGLKVFARSVFITKIYIYVLI